MNIRTLGIDLAKSIFHVHGTDAKGKKVKKAKFTRKKLMEFMVNLPPCLVGMEACGGANFWARKFRAMGHDVKLMSPQFVKPYVKTNKNDYNDAEAICEAVERPNMRFVAIKEVHHQDIQCIHRIRKLLMKEQIGIANQARGLLAEYGIVINQGLNSFYKAIPEILEDGENELSGITREMFSELYTRAKELEKRIRDYDKRIAKVYKENEECKKIGELGGIGPMTATALVASMIDPKVFKNGRQASAWVGLVPRQHTTGGKPRLLGISKRGDKYLRTLLIHGARAQVNASLKKTDDMSLWIQSLVARRGKNIATVALANKNMRAAWAILSGKQPKLELA